ncbi:MAG: MMPL family transporter [Aureliella sp.]
MSGWLAKQLIRWHFALLVLAAVVAAASFSASRKLTLEWNVEGMFPPGDPLVESYYDLQQRFGGNQVVLAVYRDGQLWNTDGSGLDRLETISQQLASVPGVSAVLSLSELHRILERMRGPLAMLSLKKKLPPLLDPDDELAQAMARVFEGYTHQPGSEFVAIAVLLQPNSSTSSSRGQLISKLRSVMEELPAPASEGLVTGEPVLVEDGFRMVQRDGWRLGTTSTILLVIVLFACFRSVRWTLIPLVVVHWSLLVTQAILATLGLQLTMISSTLTAVVTVVGVATSMHVLLYFQSARRQGKSRESALEATFANLLGAVAWACMTDAAGFAALMVAGVGPVRDFGLMMAVGSLVVLLAIVVVVPGLALIGSLDVDPTTPRFDVALRRSLRSLLIASLSHRRTGLLLLLILFAIGLFGSQRMTIETDFTKNFGKESDIVRGYSLIERELGGAGVWDIMLPAPPTINNNYLQQVLELENQLRLIEVKKEQTSLRLAKVLSVADADLAGQTSTLIGALPASARLGGMQAAMPEFTGALLASETDEDGNRWMRVMLRSPEQAPADVKHQLVERVEAELEDFTASPEWQQLFQSPPPPAEIAGYHIMLGALVDRVLQDQWICFLVASVSIFSLMAAATRSLKLAAFALVPNALPILLVLGMMGWFNIQVNMGAAMIAAVSLGLSVDSSIHYLLHIRRQRRAGKSQREALISAQENVGLAVVLATLALIVGFLSLCSSEFVPTVVFGSLASLTMLGGLLGNLIVLPILLGSKTD